MDMYPIPHLNMVVGVCEIGLKELDCLALVKAKLGIQMPHHTLPNTGGSCTVVCSTGNQTSG